MTELGSKYHSSGLCLSKFLQQEESSVPNGNCFHFLFSAQLRGSNYAQKLDELAV